MMVKTAYTLSDWQGYMTHAEIDAMHNIAAEEMPIDAVIVKIGAGAGTDTLAILEATQDVVIFSIDIAAGEDVINTNEHLRLSETGDDKTGCVVRIWGDSKIAGLRWPIPIDWLHVDGDHGESGILGDINTWKRHVRPGGFISFHDYGDNNWPAVKEIVDMCMVNDTLMEKYRVDTFIAFRKEFE